MAPRGVIRVRIVATVGRGESRRESLQALADCVHRLNVDFLRAHPDFPRLFDSGVRYDREPTSVREEFCTIPVVYDQGWGDCDDIAPWRSAELVVRRGIHARPLVVRSSPRAWHVIVETPHGREDPCIRLGMGSE